MSLSADLLVHHALAHVELDSVVAFPQVRVVTLYALPSPPKGPLSRLLFVFLVTSGIAGGECRFSAPGRE